MVQSRNKNFFFFFLTGIFFNGLYPCEARDSASFGEKLDVVGRNSMFHITYGTMLMSINLVQYKMSGQCSFDCVCSGPRSMMTSSLAVTFLM